MTLDGFLYLQQVFIERGKTETPWRVLRHFGYDNALRIKSEYIDRLCGAHVQCTAEHHYELTDNGLRFLYNMFKQFDRDQVWIVVGRSRLVSYVCPGWRS